MKLALSTNWLASSVESGEEIADKAIEMGFDALELGFSTTAFQAGGFRRRLDAIPVCSVHAFCPVPVSAPQGYPELYSLASFDADARAIAKFHVIENIRFAASVGAGAVVLHAGRVSLATFWWRDGGTPRLRALIEKEKRNTDSPACRKATAAALALRRKRGRAMLDLFKKDLAGLVPELEKSGVVLALENLPYLEGFPDEEETREICAEFAGAPVRGWFDTGHHRVREMHRWTSGLPADVSIFAGMHLNDVVDFDDDHLAPGCGKVDFPALAPLAKAVGRIVFEPKSKVSGEALRESIRYIRSVW